MFDLLWLLETMETYTGSWLVLKTFRPENGSAVAPQREPKKLHSKSAPGSKLLGSRGQPGGACTNKNQLTCVVKDETFQQNGSKD